MPTAIEDIIAKYSQGQSEMEATISELRQVTPAPYEHSSPYTNEWQEHEGGVVDLFASCVQYDCTADEYDLFRQALFATPIGVAQEQPEEFDETTVPSLVELLGGDEGEQVIAEVKVDPAESGEKIEKHTPGGVQHDQESHGSWSQGASTDPTSGGPNTGSIGQGTIGQVGAEPSTSTTPPQATSPTQPPADSRGGGRASRPKTLADLSGQGKVRERLQVMVDAARSRGTRLDHVMFAGPPGLGKTTMARALANEMGANLKVVTGPSLTDREAIVSILEDMDDGDVLFIDEIHAVPTKVDEILFPVLEDQKIDMVMEDGNTIQVRTPDITFLGATTNPEGVAKPLRDRFGAVERLDYFQPKDLASVAKRTAGEFGMDLPDDVAMALANRSRGTPRLTNRLVRRLNDYLDARGGDLSVGTVDKVLNMWEIDNRGLTREDRKVMTTLKGLGTAGVNSLAGSSGVDESTIASVVEPYLLRIGFINRTPKGRTLTTAGAAHLEDFGAEDLEVAKRLVDEESFTAPVEIAKSDARKNMVFGWANVAFNEGGQVSDKQGHMIDVDELEDAAYKFAVKYRKSGDMHGGEGFGELVESMIVTEDKIEKGGFPPEMLGKWWVGFKVPEEDWNRVESGERAMFSIQGRARLEPVEIV